MKRSFLISLLVIIHLHIFAADGYMFRIYLKNKDNTSYTLDKPKAFLSKKSIERRYRQHLNIDSTDLPVSEKYIQAIEKLGCTAVAKSKWMNTISVYCSDSLLVNQIKELDCVKNTTFVWKGDTILRKEKADIKRSKPKEKSTSAYGLAYDQIATVNGMYLHDKGFRGEGMEIAVIDAGFKNVNDLLLIDNSSIGGTKNFVFNGENMFESSEHGLGVFSTMVTNIPNTYIGTAPKAKCWLLRSEDGRSEYPIEEDYWVAAAEYADSTGVDLINTSLGYTKFDYPATSYTTSQLDGKTAYMTKAAEIATTKGLFVVVSAGNEGNNEWEKIVFPSDAEHVLTVGSINNDSIVSYFSSIGPAVDKRIKPDVMVMGGKINVVGGNDEIVVNSGTSFSAPVMCGLAACLWQAYPNLTNNQLLETIKKSGSKYDSPGDAFGYGIPNMEKAFIYAAGINREIEKDTHFMLRSDSIGFVSIENIDFQDTATYKVLIVNINGKLLLSDSISNTKKTFGLNTPQKQMYIVNVSGNGKKESYKIFF